MKAGMLALACSCALWAQTLHPGKTVAGEISTRDSRTFAVPLQPGQFARVLLWPPRFPVVVRVRAGDGSPLIELHLTGSSKRAEPLVWIAAQGGDYRLELAAQEPSEDRDAFKIRLDPPRAAVPADEKSVAAQTAYNAGRGFESAHDSTRAIEAWEKAVALHRDAGNREREATVLSAIGGAYRNLGRSDRAKEYFGKALPIFREIRDRAGEGEALNGIGYACYQTGQTAESIEYLQQALRIFRALKDRRNQGESLNGLGNTTPRLEVALRYYGEALALWRAVNDRRGVVRVLGNMGTSYDTAAQYDKAIELYAQQRTLAIELGDRERESVALLATGDSFNQLSRWDEAIEQYQQALVIFREIKHRQFEASALAGLGWTYFNLNQYEKAIDYQQQALVVEREVKGRRDEAWTLDNLGIIYSYLGSSEEAMRYFSEALQMVREVGDSAGEDLFVSNLGFVYLSLHRFDDARVQYERALAIARDLKDRAQESVSLCGLGVSLCGQGDCSKAVEIQLQAVEIAREVKARREEAEALDELGIAYRKTGEIVKAAAAHQQALAIFREIKAPGDESRSLEGLMEAAKARHEPRLAIFYGKQSVNALQSVRSNLRGLEKDVQGGFLKANEQRYHTLAELLISQGRLAEAEQVLALLKEQEYFQFVRRDAADASSLDKRADLTPEEAEWDKRYREVAGRLMSIGTERGDLLAKKSRSAEETRRLTQLEQALTAGNHAFEKFLGELARNFNAKPERVEQIRETQGIMEDLRELPPGTVAIYTLVGEDKFHAILRSADAEKAYEYPIKAADLNRKVLEFREAVQNPRSDPRPLARELYQILVGGMADDLRQARAKTLMWSLDGVLRYVPIAALYDGSRYLIEDYGISVMTLASNSRLKDLPDRAWTAAEFGVTKAFGDNPALPGVAGELNAIAAILHGDVKLDDQFTSDAMRRTLLDRRPVVHIASHFRFQPGDQSRSYLLLGDGSHLSLADLKIMPNLFGGVQLLTLSACNTGVGDGTEVEGFGALAQRQGAKAVVASLWPVADSSTSQLMQAFYWLRESSPLMTKLEALREAQLKFLRGEQQAGFDGQGERGVTPARPAGAAGYAHPYYWAPFFLMGNWL